MRRTLTVIALVAIAGCGGVTTTPSAPPAVQAAVRAVPQFIQATYPTMQSLVFEGDQKERAVNIYQTAKLTSNPAPIATIQVAKGCPYGMAVDKAGTIYVADWCGGNDVELYPKGSTTMKLSITDGINNPLGLAIDGSGTLYVSSSNPPSITEYPYGKTKPSKKIKGGGLVNPFGLALDKSGNLYISDLGANSFHGAVFELSAGGSSVTNLNLSKLWRPYGLAIDPKTGYLWEADLNSGVNIYNLASGTSPVQNIPGTGYSAISIQHEGKPPGEVVISSVYTSEVYAFKPGQYTAYATLSNGVEDPTGLLITKP